LTYIQALHPHDEGSAGGGPRAFRERARQEAERYGSDPWVFVRELLQNARDAGAGRVGLTVEARDGQETVVCQDDGEGMSFDEARRYLFALYASRKEGQKNQVGKFGVGFWSILRFEPVEIIIRSRPTRGPGWGVALDGQLEHAVAVEPPDRPGTEVILRRLGHDAALAQHVHDAVWQTARHVTRRDDPQLAMEIEVNGQRVNAEFELPAPSSSFHRRHLRGVVGLGPTPRVELFSRGLRVRSAARLEDLLAVSGGHSASMRVKFPELPDGLAPVALLESADLEIMLSRSDVRDTRALARLIRLAHRELRRLVERQLAVVRPASWSWRARAWLGDRLPARSLLRGSAALAMGVLVVGMLVRHNDLPGPLPVAAPLPQTSPAQAPIAAITVAARPRPSVVLPFQDLGSLYQGPTVEGPDLGEAPAVPLRYRPRHGRYHFAALTFPRLGPDGAPLPEEAVAPGLPYPPAICMRRRCLQVDLVVRATGRAIRIPVPTGHRVVTGSVRMKGHAVRLRATAEGQPMVVLDRPAVGTLHYQTVAAGDPTPPSRPRAPALLPASLAGVADQLRALPVHRRVAALLRLVQQRVSYDDSAPTAALHRAALARREGFIQRTLAIGAGDCDVQNGLLVAIAQAAGVPARLAVGYVADDGQVQARLHGWVEYRDEGRWYIADATVTSSPRLPPTPHQPLPGGEPAVASGNATTPAAPTTAPAEAPAARPIAPQAPPAVGAMLRIIARPGPPPRTFVLPMGLLALAALGWLFGTRTRRAFKLDARIDVAKLLRGLLQQPRAFGTLGALMHRPLVPLANGRAISLAKARDLGHSGRLFATLHGSPLAIAAASAGAVVVDQGSDEGQAVVDALGAVDLDAWAAMIETATDDPLLADVNRILRSHGEEWAVKASRAVSGGLAALDLAHLGDKIPHAFGTRLVLIDVEQPWFAQARQRHSVQPQTAIFMVLDEVARRLGLTASERASLLGECAAAAILECFGHPDVERSAAQI
jgi:transglutaminase-like putative cysteine protease